MIRQEIWIPNGLGGALDDQLKKLPERRPYARRDQTTYDKNTVESWLVYTFDLDSLAEGSPIMGALDKIVERYSREVKAFHYQVYDSFVKEPKPATRQRAASKEA